MSVTGSGPWFVEICKSIGKPMPSVFVETGLYLGDHMPTRVSLFKTIHTIELNKDFIDRAKLRFPEFTNIVYHHGDSGEVLGHMASEINEPALFYLDAHYSGGETAYGKDETPLLRELSALKSRPYNDVIVIDDCRLFGKKGTCGDGSKMWPYMEFNWTDITEDSCLNAYNKPGTKLFQGNNGNYMVIA